MTVAAQVFYASNSQLFAISGVRNVSGVYLSGASAVVTIMDYGTQAAVPGQTWPLTLSFVSHTSSTDGEYQGVLSASIMVVPSQRLYAQLTITSSGATGYWEAPLIVRKRMS